MLLALLASAGMPVAAQTVVAAPSPASVLAESVAEAARRFAIPEAWIRAIMRVESGNQPRAVSAAGAMGLMQVMPATWATMQAQLRLGGDPFDIHDNVLAGVGFLRLMRDRYGDGGMLPAYNAGPGRYDDYLAHRRPLPAETVAYVTALQPVVGGSAAVPAAPDPLAWMRAGLFPNASPVPALSDGDAAAKAPSRDKSGSLSSVETVAVNTPPERLFVAVSGHAQP